MSMFRRLLAHKAIKLGIGTAFVFQIVFFTVWLTAYDGVEERFDQFTVAVINDSETIDATFMKQLQLEAPFTFEGEESIDRGKDRLDLKEVNMVMHIPESFIDDIQNGNQGKLAYYINQSTPSLEKQVMETAASLITSGINREVYSLVEEQMKESIPLVIGEQFPEEEQAPLLASFVVEQMQSMINGEMVQGVIYKEHNVDGFTATMIPLMVVLASFIGAMIMSQQMELVSRESFRDENQFLVFLNRQLINIGVSFILSMVTLCIMLLFGVAFTSSLVQVWLFQSVLFLSFLLVSQLFVVLFGNPGMIFNILLTATQLVSSGAIVPRELLPGFYHKLGTLLPATYGVNGYFSVIYGGGNVENDFVQLLLMIIVFWGIALLIIGIFHVKTKNISYKENH